MILIHYPAGKPCRECGEPTYDQPCAGCRFSANLNRAIADAFARLRTSAPHSPEMPSVPRPPHQESTADD